MSKHGSCNFRIGSKSFRTARKRLHMPDCACQSTLECVANKRFVGTSLPLTDQTLRICSSGRTWSKKAIRCSSASERPHVKARSAAGPISRSRSGGMADLVGHRGRNGEEEASQGAGSPLNEGLGRALRWDLRERWLTVLSAQNAHSVRPNYIVSASGFSGFSTHICMHGLPELPVLPRQPPRPPPLSGEPPIGLGAGGKYPGPAGHPGGPLPE